MDEPLPKVESLFSVVLRDNQDYFCKFSPELEHMNIICIDQTIVQTQNGVIIYTCSQFLKNSNASRYLAPSIMDMCFPCKVIVEEDTKELCFCSFIDFGHLIISTKFYPIKSFFGYHIILCVFLISIDNLLASPNQKQQVMYCLSWILNYLYFCRR